MSQIFWIVIFLTKFRSPSDRSRKKEKRFRFSFSILSSCKSVIDVLVRKETAHLVDHANRFCLIHSARYCCTKHNLVLAVCVKFCEQCYFCCVCLCVVVYFKLTTATALVASCLCDQLVFLCVLLCAQVCYSQLCCASAIDTFSHFCYLFSFVREVFFPLLYLYYTTRGTICQGVFEKNFAQIKKIFLGIMHKHDRGFRTKSEC